MLLSHPFIDIIVILNLAVFVMYGIDKLLAIRHRRRVPERILLLSPVPFASAGALLAMLVFRHKIRKAYFWAILIPLLVLQLYILFTV